MTCGYTGGHKPNPSYEDICNGNTGHAEVVNVTFDPDEISSEQILDIFFTLHDPTQLNRQGADVGDQYRSAMFYSSESQKQVFTDAVERAKEIWGPNVVTEVTLRWPKTLRPRITTKIISRKNPNQGYCLAVVAPKVSKVRAKFTSLLR